MVENDAAKLPGGISLSGYWLPLHVRPLSVFSLFVSELEACFLCYFAIVFKRVSNSDDLSSLQYWLLVQIRE